MTRNEAEKWVRIAFDRRSSVRYQDQKRYEMEGYSKYKKGYEIRLVVEEEEVDITSEALTVLGFFPGNPYSKGLKFVIPIYGREDFIKFMILLKREDFLTNDLMR